MAIRSYVLILFGSDSAKVCIVVTVIRAAHPEIQISSSRFMLALCHDTDEVIKFVYDNNRAEIILH